MLPCSLQVMSYLQRFKVLFKGGSGSLSTPSPATVLRQDGSSDEEGGEGSDDEQVKRWRLMSWQVAVAVRSKA